MTVKEFLKRYDAEENFSEEELNEIFNLDFEEEDDDNVHLVEEGYDELRRWSRNHTIWVSINERFFELNADEGLTELQETNYWEQPKEVNRTQVTKTIIVTENQWSYIEKGDK